VQGVGGGGTAGTVAESGLDFDVRYHLRFLIIHLSFIQLQVCKVLAEVALPALSLSHANQSRFMT
jgi:hypothetical protein